MTDTSLKIFPGPGPVRITDASGADVDIRDTALFPSGPLRLSLERWAFAGGEDRPDMEKASLTIACLVCWGADVGRVFLGDDREITRDFAGIFLNGANWPEGFYQHSGCRTCLAPFSGQKRETHCFRCEREVFSKLRPHATVTFLEGWDRPGFTPEMVPEGVSPLRLTYYSGTRNVRSMTLGDHGPETCDEVVSAAVAAGVGCVARPIGAHIFGRTSCRHPKETDTPLRPMADAPRDGTPVLLRFRFDLAKIRANLDDLSGLVFVGRNRADQGGFDDWGFAAPVGYGGLPNEWMQGWAHLREGIDA